MKFTFSVIHMHQLQSQIYIAPLFKRDYSEGLSLSQALEST